MKINVKKFNFFSKVLVVVFAEKPRFFDKLPIISTRFWWLHSPRNPISLTSCLAIDGFFCWRNPWMMTLKVVPSLLAQPSSSIFLESLCASVSNPFLKNPFINAVCV